MTKEAIEKYIQFAINNGFKNPNIKLKQYVYGNNVLEIDGISPNVIQLITSKEFIEAVARGLNKKFNIKELSTQEQIEELCKTQALFIAGYGEETFEEFILEIIK